MAVLRDLYRARVESGQAIFLEEVRLSTGYGGRREQSVDAWAMLTYPSARHLRTAYEVKVSRSDFLKEIRDPLKRRGAKMLSNEFYFVVPEGLIEKAEVPMDCGLMVVENGRLVTAVDAPPIETYPPNWGFVASVLRKVQGREIPGGGG